MRKLVTADWFGYKLPLRERYKLAKAAGFDGIMCFWYGGDEAFAAEGDDYRAAPALAEKAGLFVENAHTPFENINNIWLDNQDGQSMFDCLSACLSDCAEFHIPTAVVHLRRGLTPPPMSGCGMDRFRRLTEKAENLGINIAFENLREDNYLTAVLGEIKSPRAGFCYDSGHNNCWTTDTDPLEKYGARLVTLHLHDNDGKTDQHLLPFDGTIDWNAVMKKIAATGYAGAISLEVDNRGSYAMTAEEFLSAANARAKKLRELCI